MKGRTAAILKWVGIVIIAIGVVYAVVLASGKRALRRAYADLKADGRPITLEEIIPPAIPEPENAAPLYKAAILLLRAEPSGEGNLFKELTSLAAGILKDGADAEGEELFRALCQRSEVQEALKLVEKGSHKRGCRHDLDYSKGAELLLPHVGEYRNLSRILCARARIRAADGEVQGAWQDLETSLRFANALQREPILISQLVRVAQLNCATDTIRFVAGLGLPDEPQYRTIAELLTQFEDPSLYALAIDGERVGFGEWGFNLAVSDVMKAIDGSSVKGVTRMVMFAFYKPVHAHDHAAYLKVMHAYARDVEAPYASDLGVTAEEELENIPAYCLLTRLCAPALGSIKGRLVSMSATARVTRAGLAAMRAAAEGGSDPESLDALNVPDLVDPFNGKPLQYRKTDSGFVVYSIGENLVDDGGTTSEKNREGDIVWECRGGEQSSVTSDQ